MNSKTESRPRTAVPCTNRHRQKGFVLTIELILITTILIIGTFVGIAAIRDALIKSKFREIDRSVFVSDDNGQVLGEMVGLDEHEAPLLFYIDRTVPGQNHRALIGIRDDRFTSREPVYYTQRNCQGTTCIKSTSAETPDNSGVSRSIETGAVSYFHALQGFPNYAIGRSPDGIRGRLFRETSQSCPITGREGSKYLSQRVVAGEPCQNFQLPLPTADGAGAYCSSANALACPAPQCAATEITDPISGAVISRNCLANPGAVPPTACASGFEAQEVDLNDPALVFQDQTEEDLFIEAVETTGTICCPTDTVVVMDAQFVDTVLNGATDGTGFQCKGGVGGGFVLAEQVPDPDPASANPNALDSFAAPFRVNLPAAGTDAGEQWFSVAPDGEG